MMQIATELQTVRMLSPRDEGTIQANLGRIQGLAQGLDFFIEQYNSNSFDPPKGAAIGFQIQGNPIEEDDEDEEARVQK